MKIIDQDLYQDNITNESLVMIYLLPTINLKLRPKLLSDLKPVTLIVSHSFDMGDLKPEKEFEVDGERIYFWTIPASRSVNL